MLRNLLLLLLSLVFSLFLAEAVLRVFTPFPIHGAWSNRTEDPELMFRTSPSVEGVDEEGFRNEGSQPPYDIVAIGDSHTFGYNVNRDDNWPSVVGRSLHQSVYNLSSGAYNIIQYLSLFNMALEKKPKTIIVGFYPFNDLTKVCVMLSTDFWRAHREQYGIGAECSDNMQEEEEEESATWWNVMTYHLAVASAIRYTLDSTLPEQRLITKRLLGSEPDSFMHGTIRLEDQPFRVRVLKTSNLREELSGEVRDAKSIFSYMQRTAQEQGIRLIVLFIPSCEMVLHESVKTMEQEMPSRLRQAVRMESALRRIFKKYFVEQHIEYADALSPTSQAFIADLKEHKTFYPFNNGHPMESGYQAYAQAVLDYLQTHPQGNPGAASQSGPAGNP